MSWITNGLQDWLPNQYLSNFWNDYGVNQDQLADLGQAYPALSDQPTFRSEWLFGAPDGANGLPTPIDPRTGLPVINPNPQQTDKEDEEPSKGCLSDVDDTIGKFATEYSSSHGLPNIYLASNRVARLFWTLIFLTAIGAFVYTMQSLLSDFLDFNVNTEIKVISKTTLAFPAVTVCNTNRVRRSQVLQSRHKQLIFVDDLTPLPYYVPCLEGDIMCSNLDLCVRSYLACDGINHCGDYSDEIDCNYGSCGADQFKCNNGSASGYCINNNLLCNRVSNCYDGQDEWDCDCKTSEWRCTSQGGCIRKTEVCDGDYDCIDMSDEMNCPNGTSCSDGFRCGTTGPNVTVNDVQNAACIPPMFICDHSPDCPDQSDELNYACDFLKPTAAPAACPDTQFDCGDGQCILMAWKCDENADCINTRRDESAEVCGRTRPIRCNDDEYFCKNGWQCIPNDVRCNFFANCDNEPARSDEQNCTCRTTTRGRTQLQNLNCAGYISENTNVNWEFHDGGMEDADAHCYHEDSPMEMHSTWQQEFECSGQLTCTDARTMLPETCTSVPDDCYVNTNGADYKGRLRKTTDDTDCVGWNSQLSTSYGYTEDRFPLLGRHNYCRNPGGYKVAPWCFIVETGTKIDGVDAPAGTTTSTGGTGGTAGTGGTGGTAGTGATGGTGAAGGDPTNGQNVVADASITLDQQFEPALNNMNSPEARALAGQFENEMNGMLNDDFRTDFDNVQVTSFTQGSVVTEFTVSGRMSAADLDNSLKRITDNGQIGMFRPVRGSASVRSRHNIPASIDCTTNPSNPSCLVSSGGNNPANVDCQTDHSCPENNDPETVNCQANPDIPACRDVSSGGNNHETVDCDTNPDNPSCRVSSGGTDPETVNCQTNPDDPSCRVSSGGIDHETVDCDTNPDNPSCRDRSKRKKRQNEAGEGTHWKYCTLPAEPMKRASCHFGVSFEGIRINGERLEIQNRGQWGTVSDPNWDLNDAQVACRTLGLGTATDAITRVPSTATGPVWISNIDCNGEELNLLDCVYTSTESNDHSNDVGVRCSQSKRKRRETTKTDNLGEVFSEDTYENQEQERQKRQTTGGLGTQAPSVVVAVVNATDPKALDLTLDPETAALVDEMSEEFKCIDKSMVIPLWQTCNNYPDCPDGSDEIYCGPRDKLCDLDSRPCRLAEQCIEAKFECDGVEDCEHGLDEAFCNITECPADYWKCPKKPICIPRYSRCDTVNDCGDRTDEDNCTNVDSATAPSPFDDRLWYQNYSKFADESFFRLFEDEYYQKRSFHRVKGEDPVDWKSFFTFSSTADYADLSEAFKITREEIRILGHQQDDFILECSYDQLECSKNFTWFETDKYGNCYTFNFAPTDFFHATKTGSTYGLRMTLNLQQDQFISLGGREAGVRVTITAPDTRPLPDEDGITIRPGVVTSIGMRFENISRLGGLYGTCAQSDTKMNILEDGDVKETTTEVYDRQVCLRTCLHTRILKYCGCSDTIQLKGPRCHISNLQQDTCKQLMKVLHQSELLDCECPQQCVTRTYTKTTSTSKWPSNVYRNHLLRYIHSINPVATADINDRQSVDDNLVRLEVFFEQLNYATTTEVAATSLASLISNIGGTAGLYIGFSLVTFLEFGVLVHDLVRRFCVRRRAPRGPGRVRGRRLGFFEFLELRRQQQLQAQLERRGFPQQIPMTLRQQYNASPY